MPAAMRRVEGPRARDCGVPGQTASIVNLKRRQARGHLQWPLQRRHLLSLRPDKPKRELVGWNLRVAGRLLARIGGIAQKVALGFEDEARLAHFREDDGLVDAVQGLPY